MEQANIEQPDKPKRIRRSNAEVAAEKAAIAKAKAEGKPIPKKQAAKKAAAKKPAAKAPGKGKGKKKPAEGHVLDRQWDKCMSVMDMKFKKHKIVYVDPLQDAAIFSFSDLLMHVLFGSKFIRTPGLIQIMAPQSSGKTSLNYTMIGDLVRTNHLCVYFECEEKRFKTSQILRLLSRDKAEAKRLARRFKIIPVNDIAELFERIEKMAPELRKIADSDPSTADKPIWFFVDTWSTLMSKAEAKGRVERSDDKDKIQTLEDVSNLGHSQFANRMKRVLPSLFRQYKIQLVFNHHPTVKIDMSGSYASKKAPPVPDWANDTTTGGKALQALASYRISLTTQKMMRNTAGETIGRRVRMFVQKNSFGCEGRSIFFDLKMDPYTDTDTTYENPISFAEPTAEWMATESILGTTVTRNRYTCPALAQFSATAQELYAALMAQPAILGRVGSELRIEGYAGVASAEVPVAPVYDLPPVEEDDEDSSIFGADFGADDDEETTATDEQEA
jgi:RecA/RadA recombinase